MIYATLKGTNYETEIHLETFNRLKELADSKGFIESENVVQPIEDQTDLRKWKLELKGRYDEKIKFLLAVTAAKPSLISPVPIKKDTSGYLFSVIYQTDSVLIWSGLRRKFFNPRTDEEIDNIFIEFLIDTKYNSQK